jgi:hypothetical protein
MTSITNISMPSPSNIIRTPPPPMHSVSLSSTYSPTTTFSKQHHNDLGMGKSSSTSTLVNLLKQRRSPPPQSSVLSLPNAIPTLTTTQQKEYSIIKQTKKLSKKSQSSIKRLAVNHDNHDRVHEDN